MKAFLISPVRGHEPRELEGIVKELESDGWDLHWPMRDTPQDVSSIEICEANTKAISQSDIVFIIWDGKSTGSLFDLGVVFALNKELRVISAPERTDGKSFQNLMYEMEAATGKGVQL